MRLAVVHLALVLNVVPQLLAREPAWERGQVAPVLGQSLEELKALSPL